MSPVWRCKGRVVTKSDKVIEEFREHLRVLRAGREDALAQIEASRKTIEQSRALIAQLDEQIGQTERELGLYVKGNAFDDHGG
jgi:chromosome segregation ATPase